MRRLASTLGLAFVMAACSQPDYFDMKPTTVTFESRGATRTVRAVAMDRRGNEFATEKPTKWTSSDEKVATVDENGKVTAMGSGVATIRAHRGELVGEVLVDVNTADKLILEPGELTLAEDGQPILPTIKLLDGRGKPLRDRLIRVKCADEKICNTDAERKVWPVGPGETTYEVSYDGLKAEMKVKVEPAKGRR